MSLVTSMIRLFDVWSNEINREEKIRIVIKMFMSFIFLFTYFGVFKRRFDESTTSARDETAENHARFETIRQRNLTLTKRIVQKCVTINKERNKRRMRFKKKKKLDESQNKTSLQMPRIEWNDKCQNPFGSNKNSPINN